MIARRAGNVGLALLAVVVLAMLGLLAQPAQGQEATPEAVPVEIEGAGAPPSVTSDVLLAAVGVIVLVIGSFVAGGATVGAVMLRTIKHVRNDPVIMDFGEKLYNSMPMRTRQGIRDGVEVLVEGAGLIDELTDGKPAVVPPT